MIVDVLHNFIISHVLLDQDEKCHVTGHVTFFFLFQHGVDKILPSQFQCNTLKFSTHSHFIVSL